MAAITPPLRIDPLPVGPLRYGLFAAAMGPLDLPTHARVGGIQWETVGCGVAQLYNAECPPSAQDAKTFDESDDDFLTSDPFVAYASQVCAPVGRTVEEHRRRVTAQLMGGEQTVVESVFWSGGGFNSLNLEDAGILAGATTLTGFAARIAHLENTFYQFHGYQGTIHISQRAEGAAARTGMIRSPNGGGQLYADAGRLQTPLGSIWSFGAGYGINGPGGAAPVAGSVYAFITPQVTVYRSSEIFIPDPAQTLNRTTNQMFAVAEREYTYGWACPTVLAIEVPLETTA